MNLQFFLHFFHVQLLFCLFICRWQKEQNMTIYSKDFNQLEAFWLATKWSQSVYMLTCNSNYLFFRNTINYDFVTYVHVYNVENVETTKSLKFKASNLYGGSES